MIRRDGGFLLCRRALHKRHGGLWEFPGGKVEAGESWLDAARRELREELGLEVVAAGEPVFAHRDPGSEFLISFVEVEVSGEPRALEHEEVRWVAREELRGLELAPADRAFVEAVVDAYSRNSSATSTANPGSTLSPVSSSPSTSTRMSREER